MRHALPALLLFAAAARATPAEPPAFYLSATTQPLPGETAEVLLRSRGEESGAAHATVFRVGQPDQLLLAVGDFRRVLAPDGGTLAAAVLAARQGRKNALGLERLLEREVQLDQDYSKPAALRFETPLAGLYLVSVALHEQAAFALVNCTSLALVWKRSPTDAVAFAADRVSGAPRAGVRVRVRSGETELASARTGKGGLARLKLDYRPRLLVVARGAAGELALLDHELYPAEPPALKAYLFSDRPVYRPGETVFVKGLVRELQGEVAVPPPEGTAASLEVADARGGSLLAARQVTLAADGSFNAELQLPKGAALGRAVMKLSSGAARFAGEFEVQEYKKPQFAVVVRPEGPLAVSGEPGAVEIAASYYGGGPVSSGSVRYRVTRTRFLRPLWRRARPGWYQGEAELRAAEEELIEEKSAQLDEHGKLRVSFATGAADEDFTYAVRATVFDAARAAATGSGSVLATRGEFQIAVRASRAVVPAGEEVEVQLAARSYAGQPVQAALEVAVVDLDTSAVGAGLSSGVRSLLVERKLTTGADGTASFRFRPAHAGHLRAVARAHDSRGRELSAVAHFWAAGNEAVTLRSEGLSLVADKESYEPGETAQLLVVAPAEGAHVFLAVEGRRIERAEVRRARGNTLLVPLALDAGLAALAPNVHVSVAVVSGRGIFHASLQLAVAPVARLVIVSVQTDRPRYGPREHGKVRVRTTDARGQPISAQVALAGVDESLYAVMPELAPPLVQFFVPRRRNAVGSADSSATASYGYALALPGRGDYLARLHLERERARADEQRAEGQGREQSARARSYQSSTTSGDFAEQRIAGALERPPPAPAMMDSSSGMALASIGSAGRGGMVAKGEVALARPGVEERKQFATTILWQPSLRTNAAGFAEVDVGFPDDLTSWRFTARASTADGRFGDATAQAVTSQALVARLSAPQSLTERDRVSLGATVQNNTAQAQSVTVRLEASGLKLLEGARRTLEVPAGQSAGVTFLAEVQAGSEAAVKLHAQGDGAADALALSIPIQPHGAPRFAHASGLLGEDAAHATLILEPGARPGTARLKIRALSGPQAAIDGALPALIGYPYGCVEQTLSKFVPDLVALRVLQRRGMDGGELAARLAELYGHIAAGVQRLRELQNPDGSFGWFERQGFDAPMTAHAVAALGRARDAGADLPDDLVAKTTQAGLRVAQSDAPLEVRAEAIYGLAFLAPEGAVKQAEELIAAARTGSPFSQALLSLAFATQTRHQEARELAELVAKSIRLDQKSDGRALHNPVEILAVALDALVATQVAPAVAESLARALYEARHGGTWGTTRDSAAAVTALADYLFAKQGAVEGEGQVQVELNGRALGRVQLAKGEAAIDLREGLREGANELKLRHVGKGFAAYDASLSWMSAAELTAPSSAGLDVSRRVAVLVADGARYREQALAQGQTLRSGDLLSVRVEVRSDEARRYVIVEVPRPSGFTVVEDEAALPISLRSFGQGKPDVHREDRDGFTAFFLRELPAGLTELTVLLRADQPGHKHVLPVVAQAMYSQEIAGASGEVEVTVQ